MSWPTSYQQQLPSSVSSGWNDPPSVTPGGSGSRLSKKRVVDPSINGPSNQQFGAGYGQQQFQQPTNNMQASGYNANQNVPQAVPNQQVYQQPMQGSATQYQTNVGQQGFRLTPQLPAGDNSAALKQCKEFHQMLDNLFIIILLSKIYDIGKSLNFKISSFVDFFHFLSSIVNDSLNMSPTTLNGHQAQTSQSTHPSYRPVYDAFSVAEKQRNADIFSTRKPINAPQTSSTWTEIAVNEKLDGSQTSIPSSSFTNSTSLSSSPQRVINKQSLTAPSTPTPSNSLERQQTSLIYSAPNCITENAKRGLSIDSSSYRAPIKAAGDVSLTGSQCVAFLTKATLRLHPVKCEGIQLRLAPLKEQVSNNAISESCVKKLNFVVDAIDREQYEDAWNFFEQLQHCFPSEMGTWTHGLKLLITELRRSPLRTGSAGSQRLRTQ